ncbi:hypothetical protein J7J26_01260, partial [Candidatus Micrarchaeota archaeon]|nr:hypothetical protein [Candidatus Micrarchaeota archaeon]
NKILQEITFKYINLYVYSMVRMLSSKDESELINARNNIERLLKIVKDPNISIAISAFNDIKRYKQTYLEKGMIETYNKYMKQVVDNTPHYEIKIAAISELYASNDWDGLYEIGNKTTGNDKNDVRIRRIITNIFYESIKMLYDNSILGNMSRAAGIGTGGISIIKTDIDQNKMIRYLNGLAKTTGDKEIINKLRSLKKYRLKTKMIS